MPSVLLVDDEQEILETIQPFLEVKGCTVWTAANGDDAVALITRHHPDVVYLRRVPDLAQIWRGAVPHVLGSGSDWRAD